MVFGEPLDRSGSIFPVRSLAPLPTTQKPNTTLRRCGSPKLESCMPTLDLGCVWLRPLNMRSHEPEETGGSALGACQWPGLDVFGLMPAHDNESLQKGRLQPAAVHISSTCFVGWGSCLLVDLLNLWSRCRCLSDITTRNKVQLKGMQVQRSQTQTCCTVKHQKGVDVLPARTPFDAELVDQVET